MRHTQPIFDPTTHYRVLVRGQVNVDWLQSFLGSAGINITETGSAGVDTEINVQTDQAGIVGLVGRLHGMGMTILHVEVISGGGE